MRTLERSGDPESSASGGKPLLADQIPKRAAALVVQVELDHSLGQKRRSW